MSESVTTFRKFRVGETYPENYERICLSARERARACKWNESVETEVEFHNAILHFRGNGEGWTLARIDKLTRAEYNARMDAKAAKFAEWQKSLKT